MVRSRDGRMGIQARREKGRKRDSLDLVLRDVHRIDEVADSFPLSVVGDGRVNSDGLSFGVPDVLKRAEVESSVVVGEGKL